MFRNRLDCVVIMSSVVMLIIACWQPAAAQQQPASQSQAQPAAPDEQTSRIDQMLKEAGQVRNKGQYEESGRLAEEALKLSQAIGNKLLISRSLNELGTAYRYRGQTQKALEMYRQAAAIAGEDGNQRAQAAALYNMGDSLRLLGRFKEALDPYNTALSIFRQQRDRVRESVVLKSIGLLYSQLGDYDKAESTLQDALRLAREMKSKQSEQITLDSLGRLEREQGRLESALKYYEQALALVGAEAGSNDSFANPVKSRLNLLNSMGIIYGRMNNHQKAVELYRQALDIALASKDKGGEALVLSNLGKSLYKLGQFSEALDLLTRARALNRQVGYFFETEYSAIVNIALVQRAMGRNEDALAGFREAITFLERMRINAVATEATTAAVIAARGDIFIETIDLLIELKREAEALNVAEAYRARVLLDLIAESKIDLRQDLTKEQREREDNLFNRISAIQKELWKEGLPEEREQQLKKELRAAEDEIESLRVELRSKSPRYANLQHPEILDPARIQRELLDTNTALVKYVLGTKRSFAWVVSKERISSVVLPPRKEVEQLVAEYRQALAEKVSALTMNQALARFTSQSQQLYKTLFQPLEGNLSTIRRLIVIPDGSLAHLPFETLLNDAQPATQAHYLLERFSISYAPSASALAAIKTRARESVTHPKMLIAFGDPIYAREAAGERSSAESATGSDLNYYAERGLDFNRLPYTRDEVVGIGSLFPESKRQMYLGDQAVERIVKSEKLDQYRYIHFAAHGLIDEERPVRSGIVLSIAGEAKEDGVLQMGEIMRLKLNADLVTLSACRTGLGKLISGEGIVGLTRAFFYAGASNVLVSLWNVNDMATAELMKAFYQNLNRGLSKDEALRQAKLGLVKGKHSAWRHPYYWAPFVLVGERQ